MTAVASGEMPIVDLRGQLPTAGQYPLRDMNNVDAVVVHHSASRGQSIRNLAEYHIAVRGWSGIGYHFAVGWNGVVYMMNDVERRTNHAQGHNSHTIGVVMVGSYDTISPSDATIESTLRLIQHLGNMYGADSVVFHRDLKATACPGQGAVDALRERITEL
jgi:hypothetical protein